LCSLLLLPPTPPAVLLAAFWVSFGLKELRSGWKKKVERGEEEEEKVEEEEAFV
jgi:hypothetical protein